MLAHQAQVNAQLIALICKMVTLMITLAWNTPQQAEACELADELFDLLD